MTRAAHISPLRVFLSSPESRISTFLCLIALFAHYKRSHTLTRLLLSYLTNLVVTFLIFVLIRKMGSPSHEIKDLDETTHRPMITPQDEIVSSYLEKRSDIFRDLMKVKTDVGDCPSLWQTPLTFRIGKQ